jgi:hypothetical protein
MPNEAKAGKPVRFIILTNGRSGSNFVVNILNQHPNVVNYGEVLGEWTLPHKLFKRLTWLTRWDWAGFINWLLSSRLAHIIGQWRSIRAHQIRGHVRRTKPFDSISAVGFKDFFFLIERSGLADFITTSDFRIIHLRRDDSLARAVSLQRMAASGQAVQHESSAKPAVHIDTARLLQDLDAMAREQAFEDRLVSALEPARRMQIDYQDYFFDIRRMDALNQNMFEFLGVAPCVVQAEHKKISGDALGDDILNLEQVILALRGTPHAALASAIQ